MEMDDQQKQHLENQKKLDELLALSKKQDERMDTMEQKINPMYLVFSNIQNFNSVFVWILKALILFGAALGVLYGAVKWLKNPL
jgi:hypothetical protein